MPRKSLAKKDRGVVGFFGSDPVERAIRASSFDIQEEIEILIRLVRDPDPKVALSALKQFRLVLKEVATVNGMFGSLQQTKKISEDGEVIEQKMSTNTLLKTLRKDNEQNQESDTPRYEIHSPRETS